MEVTKLHGMGNHFALDGTGCSENKLRDEKLIFTVLNDLPVKIGMKKITQPKVIYHEAKNKSESGVTGFVILCESHISIHTYPEKQFMVLDVFSVKEFNVDKMVDYIKKVFGPKEVKINLLKREYNGRQ